MSVLAGRRARSLAPVVFVLFVLVLVPGIGTTARADDVGGKYGIGVGLASPSAGLSLHARLDDRYSGALVLGDLKDGDGPSFQAQVNRGRSSSRGGYFLLGAGNDDLISLVRAGYGYRVALFDRLHLDLEAALNVPVRSSDSLGLAGIGYLFPFAASVRYIF